MKERYLYGNHIQIFTKTYIGYIHAEHKQKSSEPPKLFPPSIRPTTKGFYFCELKTFKFPEVNFKFPTE